MPEFYMILAGKIIKIPEFFLWNLPEKLTKFRNFTRLLPEKMPEFYIIIARKIFFPHFWGARAPRTPHPLRLCTWHGQWLCGFDFVSNRLSLQLVCGCVLCVQHVAMISSSVITQASVSQLATSVTVILSVAIIRTNTTAVSDISYSIQLFFPVTCISTSLVAHVINSANFRNVHETWSVVMWVRFCF